LQLPLATGRRDTQSADHTKAPDAADHPATEISALAGEINASGS